MSDSSQAENKGKIFDSRYQIFEIVGRGASSVVYRAKHVLNEDKEIALKVLLPSKGKEHNSDLLRHESLALITARHKNVIRLEDFRSVDSICYLAMEYAPESNLANYFNKQQKKLPFAQAERFFIQVTEALSFLHNIGMLHRDIKPENILVINNRQVRLSDFGVATLPGQTTSTEELQKGVGTLSYMAPEIFKGEVSGPGADIYSLGLTFYEIFSGNHPFDSLPLAQALDARMKQNLVPLHVANPEVPVYLSKAISICLEGDLEKRFYNAIELLNFLKNKEENLAEINDSNNVTPTNIFDPEPVAPAAMATETARVQIAPEPVASIDEARANEVWQQWEELDDQDWDDQSEQESTVNDPFATTSNDQEPEVVYKENYIQEATQDPFDSNVEPVTKSDDPANFDDFNYDPERFVEQKKSLRSNIVFYSIMAVLFYFAYQTFFVGQSNQEQVASSLSEQMSLDSKGLTFPQLPSGIYSGSIQGLSSHDSTALTIIALPKGKQLAVLVGIPGWQPVLVDIPTAKNEGQEPSLDVVSNGIVLHLQGSTVDGIIKGKFKNTTNNTEGSWSITAAKS